ncbi:MAG TPA: nickel pincer cofactor biosynthesis protein LarC [Candidatus Limnocylindrales bacterium]|nr:nickel pincer cofactor biosynthesis protein LarC [Candidatus Limnocylindrales bacterium]
MKTAYFEASSGIAGDMTVAALLDAGGLDVSDLRHALAALPVDGYSVDASRVGVAGVPALHFHVALEHARQPHRHWSDISRMLDDARGAGISAGTHERAMAIFERLARAEAEVHRVDIDHVHFHEVGAVDSIVDIVGAAWCLDALAVEACFVGSIAAGSGYVDTEHGRLPVPAPATAVLLRGFDVILGDGRGELVTPTGAAILAAMARPFRPIFQLRASGAGAGTRRLEDRPNVLRVFLGEADERSEESLVMLEAEIDDMTPAALAHACEALRAQGARDVTLLPVQMKKGRLGMRLAVLCDLALMDALARQILTATSTLGIRYRAVPRQIVPRRIDIVETEYGPIAVKIAVRPDGSETAEPEFEDVARASLHMRATFADVRAAALAAARRGRG